MQKRSLVTAAASVALLLGMATPAAAGGDGGRDGLKVSPSSAAPGDRVIIKADKAKCKEGGQGTAASQAFSSSEILEWQNNENFHGDHHGRHHDGQDDFGGNHHGKEHHGKGHHGKGRPIFKPFAKATIAEVEPGTYEVTAFCADGTPLHGEVEVVESTGVGGAPRTGLGGLASGSDSGTVNSTTAVATAAGGAALAGLGGYLFVMRRRANADQA
jgi:hypothetical protein